MFGARFAAISLEDERPDRFPRGRWSTPGPMIIPDAHRADLWYFDLESKTDIAPLADCLNPEEQARAARFLREEHGRRFAAFRGLLRQILAKYLDIAPQNIPIKASEHGKPYLATAAPVALRFSVSHSENRALYAFGGAPSIGIDCECISRRHAFDLDGLSERVMNEEERACLRSSAIASDAATREKVFLQLWTVKEATLKALGTGLDRGLDTVAALPALTNPDGDTWHPTQAHRLRRWSFTVEDACVAALAVEPR